MIRRFLLIMLAVILALPMCACGEDKYEYLRVTGAYIYSYGHLADYPDAMDAGIYYKLGHGGNREFYEEFTDNIVTFGDTEYVYAYSNCYPTGSSAGEYNDFYSIYDVYQNTSEKSTVTMLRGTDIVAAYKGPSGDETDAPLTNQEAHTVAKEWLLQFMSEKTLNHFNLYESSDVFTADYYSFFFRRYIGDYATDEIIAMTVTSSGTVTEYSGYNVQKYDTLVDNILVSNIDDAYSRLLSEIDSFNLPDFKISANPTLVSNQSGDVYIRLLYTFTDEEGRKESGGLITNINLFPTELIWICAGVAIALVTTGIALLIIRHRKKKSI